MFLLWIILPLLMFFFGAFLWMKQNIPKSNSTSIVSGLHNNVVISRDEWGVPLISAELDLDAFYALGLVHAQDRLWQMDYQRRLGKGKLAEILGVSALPSDKLMRTLGLNRAALLAKNSLSKRTISILHAYSEGVNQGISELPLLPLEFYYFGIDVEPWTPSDSLLLIKLMAMNLGANFQDELSNSILVKHLGVDRASELLGTDFGLVKDITASVEELVAIKDFYEDLERQFQSSWEGVGSNAWVVSGQHTESRLPIVSGDPHLKLQLPSTFYLARVSGRDLSVSGATIPGVPAVIFGHNNYIAWSGTNLAADVQDIYLERQHLVDENLFEYNGNWLHADIKVEKIKVAREFPAFLRLPYRPIEWQVRSTKNGPLLSDVFGSERHFSLKWSALDSIDKSLQSFLDINYASNSEEFRVALEQHHAPALSFAYGDVKGNIALFTAGKIPIRNYGKGLVPISGWNDNSQWRGYIPFESMPNQVNPSSGVIVTANNRIHSQDYSYLISNNWQPDYRVDRISDLLNKQIQKGKKFSLGDMAAIQNDVLNLHAEEIVPFLLLTETKTKAEKKLISLLNGWDNKMSVDSAGAAIFTVWSSNFYNRVVKDELKAQLNYPHRFSVLDIYSTSYKPEFTARVVNGEYVVWCDDITTEREVESCEKMARMSLDDSIKEIKLMMWGTTENLKLKDIQTAKLPHLPFSRYPLLQEIFNKEYASGGGIYTVNVASSTYSKGDGYVKTLGATYRQIIDLNDLSQALFILDTGQSGHRLSPHYDDMMKMFVEGDYVRINRNEPEKSKKVQEN